ncbi:pleckstrin homology domain-containing family M member 2 [Nephila pilipes]|uniref:Pleckstrin homology domain-containing family M member 2 n=1 Tax=Nephila pilipes TaxID=299642 RepID=A0A8X6PV43_NEPPI|nr:pleckstrin homology domain-containing family M member 2 [Nephila pilipes]
MVSTIPIAGTFSLSNPNEDSKERILFTLQVAVKQIHHCSCLRSEGDGLTLDVKEVRQLCESLDKALFHGLKCCEKGYWAFVREFTHSSTIQYLEKLKNVNTEIQCGRAWMSLALNESSLESYFRSFIQNVQILKKHYQSLALLCDPERMQLVLMLMAGLEYVPVSLNPETMKYGNGLSFFESSSYTQNLNIIENPEYIVKSSKGNFMISSPELLPCESASEVTCDYNASSPFKTSPESQKVSEEVVNKLHKSDSSESNQSRIENLPQEELEMISRLININTENESKSGEDLEVIRTKVVRRTKRSNSQKPDLSQCVETSDCKLQSDESNSSLENRLSKATTDSGLCLETPYSSDNDSGDLALNKSDDYDCEQISFQVNEFQQEFSVTFSTPKRKSSNARSVDSRTALEERGMPEGQEDPIKNVCGSLNTANRSPLLTGDDGKDNVKMDEVEMEEEEEEISIYDLHKLSYVTQKSESKPEEEQVPPSETDGSEKQSLSSFASGKTETIDIVLEEIEKLGLEKPETYDLKVGNNILLYFLVEVYEHEEETFYKIYSAFSNFSEGYCQRVYFLLSNKSIYFLKPGNSQQKFFKCGSIRYSSINYITVDLNYQGFKIMTTEKKCFPLYTASEELTRNILSNLELGIRRFIPKLPLPSVYTDATMQTIVLSKFIASQLQCEKSSITMSYYGLSRWEDYSSSPVTPSGPVYQDYLMYRVKFVKENKATAWKPAFFLLKGGVLYCMEEEKSKPTFFIQMCAPHCKGCRRIHLWNRPHAFEIINENLDSLQLAASDTYEASKWLQYFLETVSLAGHFIDSERKVQRPACVLVANGKILIAIEESRKSTYKLLNKASICDLVSVFVDPKTPNYVMLEFEIAEASKSSGEWIFYFESPLEKEKFLDDVSNHWSKVYHVSLNVENIKDLYLLKKYHQVSAEINAEMLALEDFLVDN